jgi:iron(III) transport system ATP-binding protein
LYETPANRFLADFIGDANLVDGALSMNGAGAIFSANGASAAVRAEGAKPGPATLALRPHRLHIVDAGQGVLPGVCQRAAYLGNRIEYVVATAWGELLVFDAEGAQARQRDEPVGLAFDAAAAIVIPAGAA